MTLLQTAAGMQHPVHHDGAPHRSSGTPIDPEPLKQRFIGAMEDDLDTPRAIVALVELAEAIVAGRADGRPISQARQELRELAEVLGVILPAV